MLVVSTLSVEESDKKKIGLRLATSLVEAFEEATGAGPHDKRKWIGHAAAMLLFIDTPEDVRKNLMHQLAGIGITDLTWEDLTERAKAGELRKSIDRVVHPRISEEPLIEGEPGNRVSVTRKR